MKKYLLVFLGLLVFTACSTSELHEPEVVSEEVELTTEYCVEWDGWIDRSRLDYQCYVLQDNEERRCEYTINDNNLLEVTAYNMSAEDIKDIVLDRIFYKCSLWVEAHQVEVIE